MTTAADSSILPQNWKKNFLIVWIGQAFSLLGSSLVSFALVWWMTTTTGSAVILTTAMLVSLLPEVFLSPFAGALVDRLNRKKVMIISDACIAAATLVMGLLFWLDAVQIWHVYVLLFIRALGGTFQWPAMNASISLMVPEKELGRIAGLNQAIRGVLNIVGPPLGALLLSLLPMFGVLFIDIGTAALAIGALFFVIIPQPAQAGLAALITPRQVLEDVGSGFRYIYHWKGLFVILIGISFINFFLAPTSALMPLLVTNHFQGNAWHLGILDSAFGIGVVVGSLGLTAWGGFKKKIITSLAGILGVAAGTLIVGLAPAPWFAMAVAGMALIGLTIPFANGPFHALIQSKVAPEVQGRVFSTIASMASVMQIPAMLISGQIADGIGIHTWYFISAAGCFAIVVLMRVMPAVKQIEENHVVQPAVSNLAGNSPTL